MKEVYLWSLAALLHLCALLTLSLQMEHLSPVTEQDIALLSSDRELPHCFSRFFTDLTCYWDEEEMENDEHYEKNGSYAFFYSYEGESEEECPLNTQYGNRTLYFCQFLEDDVRLFNDLILEVKDKHKGKTLYTRKIEVQLVGLPEHPTDIKAFWTGNGNMFQATWEISDKNIHYPFFIYEVQYWPENATEKHYQSVQTEELFCDLGDLQLGQLYHLHVRTRNTQSSNVIGFWGPWTEEITFFTPHSAEHIGLKCFTSDLSTVCCNWNKTAEDSNELEQLFYQFSVLEWQSCISNINMTDCRCVFMARNDSTVSLRVNVSHHAHPVRTYYKEPFWINHFVLPSPPELTVKPLSEGKLELKWSAPVPGLEEHLIYQIRYLQTGNTDWKTLQILHGVQNTDLQLTPGLHYTLQIRAGPSGEKITGFWSKWSPQISIRLSSSTGWIVTITAVSLLLVSGMMVCTYCIFPSHYRKLKDKLWPPLPNLNRVLDTFLIEIQKQYQPSSTLYEKPIEEAPQSSCLEILCEEEISTENQQTFQDYVQLSPPTYQNEEYWPKIDMLILSPSVISVNTDQPANGITNHTYLPIDWNQEHSGIFVTD